jgi:hypothetical protein
VDFGDINIILSTIPFSTAFGDGSHINKLKFGSGTIEEYSFQGCVSITSLDLGQVTSIGGSAFMFCNITDITVDSSNTHYSVATNLGSNAKVVIDNSNGVFDNTSKAVMAFGELIFPTDGSITTITETAFYECTGISGALTIPSSVTSIGDCAFWQCRGITSLDLGQVTSIGDEAFRECTGISGTLSIPDSVTSIGYYAFSGCKFTDFTLESENANFSLATNLGSNVKAVINNSNGVFDNSSLIAGSLAIGELTIPSTLTSIGNYAFEGCTGISGTLTIPSSVTSIGNEVFFDCSGISALVFDGFDSEPS